MAGFYFHPWRNCDSGMLTLNLLNEDACQTIHMLICCSFISGEFHLFPTSLYTTLHAYFFIHLKYSVFILYHSVYCIATLLNNWATTSKLSQSLTQSSSSYYVVMEEVWWCQGKEAI